MAEIKIETKQPEAAQPKAPRRYFLVNPKGAIHEVSREHAKERLRTPGYRMASSEEIAKLEDAKGHQVADKPICTPWSPDPDAQLDGLE